MKALLKKLNTFLRDLILADVDKPHNKPLPYHRKFGSKERQVNAIRQKRYNEQQEQSRGF